MSSKNNQSAKTQRNTAARKARKSRTDSNSDSMLEAMSEIVADYMNEFNSHKPMQDMAGNITFIASETMVALIPMGFACPTQVFTPRNSSGSAQANRIVGISEKGMIVLTKLSEMNYSLTQLLPEAHIHEVIRRFRDELLEQRGGDSAEVIGSEETTSTSECTPDSCDTELLMEAWNSTSVLRLEALTSHPNWMVRAAVSDNAACPQSLVEFLAQDENEIVRENANSALGALIEFQSRELTKSGAQS